MAEARGMVEEGQPSCGAGNGEDPEGHMRGGPAGKSLRQPSTLRCEGLRGTEASRLVSNLVSKLAEALGETEIV